MSGGYKIRVLAWKVGILYKVLGKVCLKSWPLSKDLKRVRDKPFERKAFQTQKTVKLQRPEAGVHLGHLRNSKNHSLAKK